jgi:archaellum component FlaC
MDRLTASDQIRNWILRKAERLEEMDRAMRSGKLSDIGYRKMLDDLAAEINALKTQLWRLKTTLH